MNRETQSNLTDELLRYINLKLAASGQPVSGTKDLSFLEVAQPLLKNYREKNRLLANYLCPSDQRIQTFLNDYLKDVAPSSAIRLPASTFILDRAGLARLLSLPSDGDTFSSDMVASYRIKQGVLHNPKNDRRTTQGVFHVTEGGFPIPDDKTAVPKAVFAKLLEAALQPPATLTQLPFTANLKKQTQTVVSLLLRPMVCPPVGKFTKEKSMEIRFFAPASLVSNLDFVETIFGNAGDPFLPENDAALDTHHWTGHTGCVILAPHLITLKKKDLGLPAYQDATERQRRDGMCWKNPDELYNAGSAFKITARDHRGVIVTVIADNYFGYCKKEVKTQISYAANLFGLCEEEHAGGALAFSSYVLGQDFHTKTQFPHNTVTFADAMTLLGDAVEEQPDGTAIDKKYPSIIYVPEDANFNVRSGTIEWSKKGRKQKIKLLANKTYMLPFGYKVRLEKQINGSFWRLVGSSAEGTLCHKPCTVSGGGKSEISKSIANSMLQGPVFVRDFHHDLELVDDILKMDVATCFKEPELDERNKRPVLSLDRSLGSVIKLFTPSDEYTDEYNAKLKSLPQIIRQLIFVVKRYYRPEWGDNWREHFSVDRINGFLGHELKYDDHKLVANYLRVGFDEEGAWRVFKVRTDFNPSDKVQVEDDITASIIVPKTAVATSRMPNASFKVVKNCESFLFQRPDDAIHRGFDKQAEADIAAPNTFLSNFEPLERSHVQEIVDEITKFDLYTAPVKKLLTDFLNEPAPAYVVSSAHPRMVDGKPSKNPRYLQPRPDIVNHRETYIAEICTRLSRWIPMDEPVTYVVDAILAGRRNNPPDHKADLPSLAVYNPIHYQELPELFMDFISSLTGKSPSTTGFGTEGALTKGPFNALWPIVDLNNALVAMILTGYDGFTTAASHVGPKIQVDHDISLLIPEIWCRMKISERDPQQLIREKYLEKVDDFDYEGQRVLASRLGYRITSKFVDRFLGRIFEAPNLVFSEHMLQPEKQDMALFVEGVNSVVLAQKSVAEHYLNDGSVEAACPPLKALIHLMATGTYQGKGITHPDIRAMFTREELLKSAWYKERLQTKQQRDMALWQRHVNYLISFYDRNKDSEAIPQLRIERRLQKARQELEKVSSPKYLSVLVGTIGADPFHLQMPTGADDSAARSAAAPVRIQ